MMSKVLWALTVNLKNAVKEELHSGLLLAGMPSSAHIRMVPWHLHES